MSMPSRLEMSVLYTPQGRGPTVMSGGVDIVPLIYTPVVPCLSLRFKRRTPAPLSDWLQRLIQERGQFVTRSALIALFTYQRVATRLPRRKDI